MDFHKWYLLCFLPIVIALSIFEPSWVKPEPWVRIYPCNLRVIDYMNGDIYIVNTASGPIYGSAQLFHHREDAEQNAERIERTSVCR